MTTIVTISRENRMTDHAYKNNQLLKYGWIHLGLREEGLVPDELKAPGMRVGIRVTNLLFRLQMSRPTVSSLMDASGLFCQSGLNSRGREFSENVLPYFVYALNTIEQNYVNNTEVWNEFVPTFISRISDGEFEWMTAG